jgi:aspartokinase-like uncharacterized kinase
MDAVIKVGGSLSKTPLALKVLCIELGNIAKTWQVTIVPGGAQFADAVRKMDSEVSLSSSISHRMAIFSMNQYGLLLQMLTPNSEVCESFSAAKRVAKAGKAAVFLPADILEKNDPFMPSWDVTSDSITAYIATCLYAKKTLFVTDVDGIFQDDPKRNPRTKFFNEISIDELLRMEERTSVDKFLPQFLAENPLDCYVVNGNYPQRIKDILLGHPTVATHILRAPQNAKE